MGPSYTSPLRTLERARQGVFLFLVQWQFGSDEHWPRWVKFVHDPRLYPFTILRVYLRGDFDLDLDFDLDFFCLRDFFPNKANSFIAFL